MPDSATTALVLTALSGAALRLAAAVFPRPAAPTPAVSCGGTPAISVLIPLRNEEAVLPETLKALALLDYPRDRLEIVFSDDGSTDATARLTEEFSRTAAPSRVLRVFPTAGEKTGRGKSAPLNRGLAKASGEWLYLLDADTLPDPGALRLLVAAALTSGSAPEIVMGVCLPRRPELNLLTRWQNLEAVYFNRVLLPFFSRAGRGALPPSGRNYLVRRARLLSGGGWNNDSVGEDFELGCALESSAPCPALFVPESRAREWVPETLSGWWRQRSRWARGHLAALRRLGGRAGYPAGFWRRTAPFLSNNFFDGLLLALTFLWLSSVPASPAPGAAAIAAYWLAYTAGYLTALRRDGGAAGFLPALLTLWPFYQGLLSLCSLGAAAAEALTGPLIERAPAEKRWQEGPR